MRSYTFTEITEFCPILQILGTIERNDITCSNRHDPLIIYPVYLRVTEIPFGWFRKYRIPFILGISPSVINTPCNALLLASSGRCIDRHNGILSKTGGIVNVNYRTSGKD